MTNAATYKNVRRGATLILVGIGLAPAILNIVMFFVPWMSLAPGQSGDPVPTTKTWLAWTSLVHAALVLPIVPGVWRFAGGWAPRAAAARAVSVLAVIAWVVFGVRRFAEGVDPSSSVMVTIVEAVLPTSMYGALAAVSASLTFALGRKGAGWLAFVTWAATVTSVWLTGRAALSA